VEERGERRTYLQARFLLLDEEGKAFATAGLATDVTDRERAVAEAREASRQKSAFLANMSHEIRTPLNAVIGMLDLLVDTPLDSEQEEYAQTARSSGGDLLRLIDDILDLSRIEASNLHLEVEDFDLNEAVDDAFDPVAAGAYARGLYLAVELDDEVPVSVRGDEGRLGQVLRNLLDNAVKFTPAGDVRLRASLSERTAGVDLVRFDVIDTGIGIEAGDEQRLFAPFVQHDASTTRRHGGTGLGLAICRHLVELMGGTIGVESRRGGGSRFWFTVPFARPEQPAVSATAPDIVGRRVLAAAHREDERGLLAAGLVALGANTTVVASFDEAVSALFTAADEGEPFDAAVVDWLAPRADWARLAVELNGLDGPHPTRLLALTGGQEDARAARRSGMAAVVPKPVRRSRLREALAMAATAPPVVAPPAQLPRSLPPGTGRTVLVVEDNPVNQRMLVLLLERRGHVAPVASSGEEALERLGEEGVDLVFMDCQMPGLDGYEAARRWRRREKGRAHVPIVAVTAHAMVGDRDKCLQAGMDDYLTKPLGADALDRTLSRWLGEAASPAEPAPLIDPGGAVDLSVLADDFPPDVARDLAERFLADAAADVEAVTAAAAAGDAAAAREAAHRLRSGCLAVGARTLNEAAITVERLAADRPAELGAMAQAVEGLLDAWGATREAFGRSLTAF
jgi:signal transduction histidine kinase/DNA-binding response OmpR family regulator/HPt (histidine-containing phosphotransfer) domain-containing protein